jgi:hypothetical protein
LASDCGEARQSEDLLPVCDEEEVMGGASLTHRTVGRVWRRWERPMDKSFFGSFFSEKELLACFLLNARW